MDSRALRRHLIKATALVLLLAGFALGCAEETSPPPPGIDDMPEQLTQDYETSQTKGGIAVWRLFGQTAERFSGSTTTQLSGVRMVFYKDAEVDAVLTSRSGEIDQETQATVARGNVVVVTEEGRQLESEILYWDPDRELIYTDAETFVRFTEGEQVLTGYGLETDPDLANLKILRQVEGAFPDESAVSDAEGR